MNVVDLREDLISVYERLKNGQIGISEAKEQANVAGKIMSTAKAQMEYNKLTGNNKTKIQFLEQRKGQ